MRRERLGETMKVLKRGWFIAITAAAVIATACGGDTETDVVEPQVPVDAKPINYIGRQAKVCGTVVATADRDSSTRRLREPDRQRQSRSFEFDKDPGHVPRFRDGRTRISSSSSGGRPSERPATVASWPDIADPSIDLAGGWFDGKKICVSARMRRYRDKAAILIDDWRQIDFLEE